MLTEEQIEEYREAAEQIVRPLEDYLLRDLAERVAAAGELTSTAAYQVWKLQDLGLSQKQIKQKLAELLDTGQEEIERLLTQSAVDGYRFDLSRLPTGEGIPFEKNESLQAVVAEAVKLAGEGLVNITQTLGMTDPTGRALPLQEVYRKTCDFAFTQVVTGTTDYQTAIRRATRELAEKGVCVVDYASGRHISVEAAVRRNVFGAMGLIQEKINADYHDRLGCDGWEISAHAASAPDHEPIQGKQYTDEEYARLNDSLIRRIGTLNCAHSALPIRLGIDRPIHSPEELRELREKNEEGITYGGRHYTSYEAKQHRRELERKIRQQRKRVLVDEATGDAEKLQNDRIRLVTMESGYKRFCDATGARQEYARLEVTNYGPKQATQAAQAKETAEQHHRNRLAEIGAKNSELNTLDKYEDAKYNNSPAYRMLSGYTRAVEKGDISPLVGLETYQQIAEDVRTQIVGQTTAAGVQIESFATHFVDRVIGQTSTPHEGMRRGVPIADVLDALQNPVEIGDVRLLEDGDIRQTFTGKTADVTVSIRDKRLIQTNPNG